jgi:hypothetical protein
MAAALIVALAGCGATAKMISAKSQSERTDSFKEVTGSEAIPAGYADVIIRASIKTHLEGYYICESKRSAHGKSAYPFLINIDGQAALWNVAGVKHELPPYVDGRTSRDPEAGDGMKYVLEKKVRLAAGMHKVFLGLPEESYYIIADISVKSGGSYVLEFMPDYRYKTLPMRIPTFVKGIGSYKAIVSEMAVR